MNSISREERKNIIDKFIECYKPYKIITNKDGDVLDGLYQRDMYFIMKDDVEVDRELEDSIQSEYLVNKLVENDKVFDDDMYYTVAALTDSEVEEFLIDVDTYRVIWENGVWLS